MPIDMIGNVLAEGKRSSGIRIDSEEAVIAMRLRWRDFYHGL